jgi:phosphoglycolate phosphatase-like HAD superfamily hydrolase
MTANHTPGPFIVSGRSIIAPDKPAPSHIIATVYQYRAHGLGDAEADANAALFALSPDLHAFVRMLAWLNASGDDVEGVSWEHDTGDSLDTLDAIVMRARELLGLSHDDRASTFHEPRGEG